MTKKEGFLSSSKILFYSSFEKDNKPSIENWIVNDTSEIEFSKDVPANSSGFSLYIKGIWGPPLKIVTAVPAVPGFHNYRLTLMAKSDKLRGAVWFGINKDSAFTNGNLDIKSQSWTKYSLDKSFDSSKDDSIYIYLKGGFSELLKGGVYFDDVTLEETD